MNEQYIERYWRDAVPQDAIKEPPMVARFRDEDNEDWFIDKLVGIDRSSEFKWFNNDTATTECQVYDAPDPGEGWRLIDIENERPQEGDEFREDWQKHWQLRGELSDTCFAPKTHYRRRIEQPKPEPRYEPFRWEDREQLRGRWIAYDDGNFEVYPTSFFLAESTFFVGTLDAQKLVDHWRFLDTGEPVGRKVE